LFSCPKQYTNSGVTLCVNNDTDILKQLSAALLLPNAFAPIYSIKNLDDIRKSALRGCVLLLHETLARLFCMSKHTQTLLEELSISQSGVAQ